MSSSLAAKLHDFLPLTGGQVNRVQLCWHIALSHDGPVASAVVLPCRRVWNEVKASAVWMNSWLVRWAVQNSSSADGTMLEVVSVANGLKSGRQRALQAFSGERPRFRCRLTARCLFLRCAPHIVGGWPICVSWTLMVTQVLPAYAGMILSNPSPNPAWSSAPRIRGDDLYMPKYAQERQECSPHTRG